MPCSNRRIDPGNGFVSEDARRVGRAAPHRAANAQKQALNLQRENILSQRTSSPPRRSERWHRLKARSAWLRHIEAQDRQELNSRSASRLVRI